MMNSKNPKGNRCMKNNCEGKKFREKPLQEKSLGMSKSEPGKNHVQSEKKLGRDAHTKFLEHLNAAERRGVDEIL
jgi:hypothetical protein